MASFFMNVFKIYSHSFSTSSTRPHTVRWLLASPLNRSMMHGVVRIVSSAFSYEMIRMKIGQEAEISSSSNRSMSCPWEVMTDYGFVWHSGVSRERGCHEPQL
ncbi:hypothetical protein KSP40_PGU015269 [Platanthera guangdongensis]|uniref:Uncharacterized protein n=1 Tax=Platanthera guangdongensis TaxID=2320717 RepID=A0ABR2MEX6_9ASPA